MFFSNGSCDLGYNSSKGFYNNINSSNKRQLARIYNNCNSNLGTGGVKAQTIYCIYNIYPITYYNTTCISNPNNLGVSVWQGAAKYLDNLLIVGTSKPNPQKGQGVVYVGDINCNGGTVYNMSIPTTKYTSIYGPRYNPTTQDFTFVGSYMKSNDSNEYGFLYRGTLTDFNVLENYTLTMNYSSPYFTITFTHSTDGNFAVGNSGSKSSSTTLSWLYNITAQTYTPIIYPVSSTENAKTTTTYGIIQNSDSSYTIVGGYSATEEIGITNIYNSIGTTFIQQYAFIADFIYDGLNVTFKNWTTIQYNNQYITHFEGISATSNPNIYTISADVLGVKNATTGFFLKIERKNNTFVPLNWIPIDYGMVLDEVGLTTSNSVIDNKIVGVFVSPNGTSAIQALVHL